VAGLVLVGLPGVGKSSAARAIAERWGRSWIDTDDVIAEMAGRPAAEVLREAGESAFRELEIEALTAAVATDAVVATGGGVVSIARARELLAAEPTIWLDCDDDVILARLADGDRPLLDGDVAATLARLRSQRSDWYREVSRARVEASGTLDDVAGRIIEALSEAGG